MYILKTVVCRLHTKDMIPRIDVLYHMVVYMLSVER